MELQSSRIFKRDNSEHIDNDWNININKDLVHIVHNTNRKSKFKTRDKVFTLDKYHQTISQYIQKTPIIGVDLSITEIHEMDPFWSLTEEQFKKQVLRHTQKE